MLARSHFFTVFLLMSLLALPAELFAAEETSGVVLPIETVTISPAKPAKNRKPSHLVAEIASTQQQRAKGLMYREQLCEDCGMLFIFPNSDHITMWMKDTYLPLDMLFIDESGKITHIHEGAVPHSTDYIYSTLPAKAVLEVNAGYVKKQRISVGDQVNTPALQ